MIINKLQLKNFRSYKGLNEFNFKTNSKKNVILIGGENGAGKSSLFEAIKICLYGYSTFQYKGMVPNYISKVKSMINEDAYKKENVEAFIEIDLDIIDNGEINNYILKREWTFKKSRFIERFYVRRNGVNLTEEEVLNFEEYFKSILPPMVFEFTFFDGEKVLDIFSGGLSKEKLKDAILTLNNLDVLNILNYEVKLSTRRQDRKKKELNRDIIEIEKIESELEELRFHLNKLMSMQQKEEKELENLENDLIIVKNDFFKAGGLVEEEKDRLLNKISICEYKRQELNDKIKKFSDDILPFLMIESKLKEVRKQIKKEENYLLYEKLKKSIDIEKILEKQEFSDVDPNLIENIYLEILSIIKPKEEQNGFKPILFLSKHQSEYILRKIQKISELDRSEIDYFAQIEKLTEEIASYRNKLRSSMDELEEEKYNVKIKSIEKNIFYISQKIEIREIEIDKLIKKIEFKEQQLEKLNEKLNIIKKADTIKNISKNINDMTEYILSDITKSKRIGMSKEFENILHKILGNDKFIDSIEIDDDFKLNLYARRNYKKEELIQLINNLSFKDLEKRLGKRFLYDLVGRKKIDSKQDLLSFINKMDSNEIIEIRTKVDESNLSSGEKQIYLLSLYWSLIKSSSIKVPFIIDTPYARIDKKYRKAITSIYLPNISHQTIVLSTNTEIESHQYKYLKEFISQEYKLQYNLESRSTDIHKGYFEEVVRWDLD